MRKITENDWKDLEGYLLYIAVYYKENHSISCDLIPINSDIWTIYFDFDINALDLSFLVEIRKTDNTFRLRIWFELLMYDSLEELKRYIEEYVKEWRNDYENIIKDS